MCLSFPQGGISVSMSMRYHDDARKKRTERSERSEKEIPSQRTKKNKRRGRRGRCRTGVRIWIRGQRKSEREKEEERARARERGGYEKPKLRLKLRLRSRSASPKATAIEQPSDQTTSTKKGNKGKNRRGRSDSPLIRLQTRRRRVIQNISDSLFSGRGTIPSEDGEGGWAAFRHLVCRVHITSIPNIIMIMMMNNDMPQPGGNVK